MAVPKLTTAEVEAPAENRQCSAPSMTLNKRLEMDPRLRGDDGNEVAYSPFVVPAQAGIHLRLAADETRH
jgi:hypothetical protein